MRHRMGMSVLTISLAFLLAACGPADGGSQAEQLALEIRTGYLDMECCAAVLELTADYGQRVYEYTLELTYEKDGDTVLTVTGPENIAGVTARISGEDTALEYDGVRVETGALNEDGMSPVDAVPAMLTYIREGFLAECGLETLNGVEALRVIYRDPEAAAGEGQECSLWFDPETYALLRGELSEDGFTVIQCTVTDFQMTMGAETE